MTLELKNEEFQMKEYRATENWIEDIHEMHVHFDMHKIKMTQRRLAHRLNFLKEELDETILAAESGDAEGVVDGLIDLGVVDAGTLDFIGVDGNLAWKRVYEANMNKRFGFNPNRLDSEGVDLYKPKGWIAPRHDDNLGILPELLEGFSLKKFEVKPNIDELISKPHKYSVDVLLECSKQAVGIENFTLPNNFDIQLSKVRDWFNKLKEEVLRYKLFANETTSTTEIEGKIFILIHSLSILHSILDTSDTKSSYDKISECLTEAIRVQMKKSHDYNSEISITQADYYPNGIDDIMYMIHLKLCRIVSVYDNQKIGLKNKNESLQDSIVDAINYASFGISWLRGKLEGQNIDLDIFNKPKSERSIIQLAKIVETALKDIESPNNLDRYNDALEFITQLIERVR